MELPDPSQIGTDKKTDSGEMTVDADPGPPPGTSRTVNHVRHNVSDCSSRAPDIPAINTPTVSATVSSSDSRYTRNARQEEFANSTPTTEGLGKEIDFLNTELNWAVVEQWGLKKSYKERQATLQRRLLRANYRRENIASIFHKRLDRLGFSGSNLELGHIYTQLGHLDMEVLAVHRQLRELDILQNREIMPIREAIKAIRLARINAIQRHRVASTFIF
ncbi:hypothetical protein B0T16DRAFT_458642 [Cercophora newfieldiana]|uniref:Uncharacterized protein n=1 Tax=Cercophora newfieldiana TaxID=92897 RepID=A0AA39Y652_9PEZI|nr:hypothetical protein B0T16DRAFT_458642 [Cercophora newfieldiana]